MNHLRESCVVHIGFHKTGSTSIQHFLWQHRAILESAGLTVYEGQHIRQNHVELHVAAMRPERITPFKQTSGIAGGAAYRKEIEDRLSRFFKTAQHRRYVFSAEGLSYLREPSELSWLKSVLPDDITIVAYLRSVPHYMAAYQFMIQKSRLAETCDKESVAYVEADSWLWNYPERLRPFCETFGADNVTVVDYDAVTQEDGNVIPSFLRELGVERRFSAEDWEKYRLNRRPIA